MFCSLLLDKFARTLDSTSNCTSKNERLYVLKLFATLSLLDAEYVTQLIYNNFGSYHNTLTA
jgi:hypothetical protein